VGATGRNDSVDISGLRARRDRAGYRVSRLPRRRVIGADVFVVRHEYYRMDLSVLDRAIWFHKLRCAGARRILELADRDRHSGSLDRFRFGPAWLHMAGS
jgi:hypothetical protein